MNPTVEECFLMSPIHTDGEKNEQEEKGRPQARSHVRQNTKAANERL
jgi:hypothetical protein